MKYIHIVLITLAIFLIAACNWPLDAQAAGNAPDGVRQDDEPLPAPGDSRLQREFHLPLPLFAPDSAWNQRADQAAVLPGSDAQILSLFRVLLGDISMLEGYDEPATEWPYMDISMYEYSIPIYLAGEDMQDVFICEDEGVPGWAHPKFGIETEGGPVTVPAPAGVVRSAGPEDSGADGHLVLYDPATFTEYDFFAATLDGDGDCRGFRGGMSGERITEAGMVDFFDLRGPGANPDGMYSARAVGTPLLAGLILPEDVESGVIAHALAFAIPGPRNTSRDPYEPRPEDYFYPASTTETDFYNIDPNALAAGQRIRLKDTLVDEEGQVIDEGEFAPITRMFLTALRDYGAYLVDNAAGFTFYAEDVHTAVLHLSDGEINALIGEPPGTPLPEGMTKWQVVFERLAADLERIPFAVNPGDEAPDPTRAQIEAANFEVVEPAHLPDETPSQGTAPTDETNASWWWPDVGVTWQWQLDGEIDVSFDVDMYDLDLFETDSSVVDALHAQGRAVICYISVGSWEEWRPDADQFPQAVIGAAYEGWPGERWLDIRQIDLLAPLLRARLDLCAAKGFDGVEPDNIDGYTNETGFPLTYEDQLAFNRWLAEEAHARGLSIGLKNDPDQVADLLPSFDWALTEDCFDEGWCEAMLPFIEAGKPVFAAEYTDTGITLPDFCPQAAEWGISAILKNRELDAWREACQQN